MAKKEVFITEIETILNESGKTLSADATTFFEALKAQNDEKTAKAFTENGKLVLKFMQENKNLYNNLFKAKDFETIGIASKTASGAMRKLVTDGYCEKLGQSPVVYALTDKGIEVNPDVE